MSTQAVLFVLLLRACIPCHIAMFHIYCTVHVQAMQVNCTFHTQLKHLHTWLKHLHTWLKHGSSGKAGSCFLKVRAASLIRPRKVTQGMLSSQIQQQALGQISKFLYTLPHNIFHILPPSLPLKVHPETKTPAWLIRTHDRVPTLYTYYSPPEIKTKYWSYWCP